MAFPPRDPAPRLPARSAVGGTLPARAHAETLRLRGGGGGGTAAIVGDYSAATLGSLILSRGGWLAVFLLSLSLTRLGFHPKGAGQRVSATPVKRLRDCRSASSGGIGSRTAIVHTSFVPADVSTLRASVDAALEDSSFRLAPGLTSSELRRALTLRVQDECTGT